MSEWHRNAQQHVSLRRLISDPRFLCRTDDIVIESGNARLEKEHPGSRFIVALVTTPAAAGTMKGRVVDGVLYLGGDETRVFPPPSIYLEPAYQKELRRRIRIIKGYNGQDFEPILDDLVKEASAPDEAASH